MATTTNYSWSTPDDTALVKDGAAAIRTLGSSVDTTTKALNPSTTLGDIEYRSSTANTNTRLGIGTTGQVLTVSGGVPAWGTASSGLTLISNTAFTTQSSVSLAANTFSATYTNYKIILDITAFSANNTFIFRARAAGSDYSGNQYFNQTIDGSGSTASASDGATNTSISLGDPSSNVNFQLEMELFRPYVAGRTWAIQKFFFLDGGGVWHTRMSGHRIDTSTQYDSASIIPSTGTMSGRIFVYGYAI